MRKVCAGSLLVVALTAAACESNTQFLDAKQGMAVETAVSRGRFELNCSVVTPTVLSREVVEPAIVGPASTELTEPSTRSASAAVATARPLSSSVPMAATAASLPAPAGSTVRAVERISRSTCLQATCEDR